MFALSCQDAAHVFIASLQFFNEDDDGKHKTLAHFWQ
jgi:hypothetical protein